MTVSPVLGAAAGAGVIMFVSPPVIQHLTPSPGGLCRLAYLGGFFKQTLGVSREMDLRNGCLTLLDGVDFVAGAFGLEPFGIERGNCNVTLPTSVYSVHVCGLGAIRSPGNRGLVFRGWPSGGVVDQAGISSTCLIAWSPRLRLAA